MLLDCKEDKSIVTFWAASKESNGREVVAPEAKAKSARGGKNGPLRERERERETESERESFW